MYKKKIKLTEILLVYEGGETAIVFYPGMVSGRLFLKQVRVDRRLLILRKEDSRYIPAMACLPGLISATALSYKSMTLEVDVFRLIGISKQSVMEEIPHGQGDTFARD